MSLQSIGDALLKEHNDLFFELIKIPENREIIFRIDDVERHHIGKPRFKDPIYSWSPDLLTRLRYHFQNIWNFFDTYSYWFDDTIKPVISFDEHHIHKQSVIFLLQNDFFQTEEMYGDYLIEKNMSHYLISYFQNNQKIQSFEPNVNSEADVEKWICLNARRQIIDQFTFLWSYLQSEIESCIKEDYSLLPDKLLRPEYIVKQNNKIADVIDQYPELALLNLGKLTELFLLQVLGLNRKPKNTNLVWMAKKNGFFTNKQARNFESIT